MNKKSNNIDTFLFIWRLFKILNKNMRIIYNVLPKTSDRIYIFKGSIKNT